jgi:hypothetical protein|tara:strand:+ start:689 stop:1009 length:321 start_codon:yes stop_codon:yes gene_type:complete
LVGVGGASVGVGIGVGVGVRVGVGSGEGVRVGMTVGVAVGAGVGVASTPPPQAGAIASNSKPNHIANLRGQNMARIILHTSFGRQPTAVSMLYFPMASIIPVKASL